VDTPNGRNRPEGFYARIGGMDRAANELRTVQSNVTARVRTLEEEFRVQLFYRGRRGVTLTAAGERLLPYAIKVTHLLEETQVNRLGNVG
jgi:DNA-binding transcriptional LysR family regulator